MDAFGAPPDEWVEALESEVVEFEVEPDNWDTVTLFTRVSTQWRYGFAGPTGLDYHGVEACMRLSGTAADPETFAWLQLMEFAALREFSEQRRAGSK